jgi:hypothetical protein
MPTKYARIAAGIVIGCVLAIACAGASGRDASPGETPKTAQVDYCYTMPWGYSNGFPGSGSYGGWPAWDVRSINYTLCAGHDQAINITWDAHGTPDTLVNVSLGTSTLARNGSGSILFLYGKVPDQENVTFINENETIINEFTFGVYLVNPHPLPVMSTDVPLQGVGVAIAIAYAAVIILGIASPKFPSKFKLVALIGNIVMPIVWFGGLAASTVTPVHEYGLMIGEPATFTINEGGGLVFFAAIDFDSSDPIYMGFEYMITEPADEFDALWYGTPLYAGQFGVSSGFTGYEDRTGFLPLPAGEYELVYTAAPSSRMEVSISVLGGFSDINPGTSIGMWRWAFLIIGICATVMALVSLIRARKKGKSGGKVAPFASKPVSVGHSSGSMIDAPFSAISESSIIAPPAPAGGVIGTPWVCETCGKQNTGNVNQCVACGDVRKVK